MRCVEPQEGLIIAVELMIEADRSLMLTGAKGKESAIGFELLHDESVRSRMPRSDEGIRSWIRIDRQNALQGECTSSCRKNYKRARRSRRRSSETWDRRRT